jgi:glycosyltransferase involved in cell wall biosynthesis
LGELATASFSPAGAKASKIAAADSQSVRTWNLITGEYPPKLGGVADYTRLVARGLAESDDEVHVWAPRGPEPKSDPRVTLHRLPDHFGPRGLAVLNHALNCGPSSRAVVQYVPHAFGQKAMNMPFCLWLFGHRRLRFDVMFHEVAFPLHRGQPIGRNIMGVVHRLMARLVARSAERIFVASSAWLRLLRRLAPHTEIEWCPVPSNIPVVNDQFGVSLLRQRYGAESSPLIGHFGTYSPAVASSMSALLPGLLHDSPTARVLLMGRNGCEFLTRWGTGNSATMNRVYATGALDPAEISLALGACDLMIQPYPDGVSTRRGSVMAGLVHGLPIVTTTGMLTESLWHESGAVSLVAPDDVDAMHNAVQDVIVDRDLRRRLANAGRDLYERRFALCHTISALRRQP